MIPRMDNNKCLDGAYSVLGPGLGPYMLANLVLAGYPMGGDTHHPRGSRGAGIWDLEAQVEHTGLGLIHGVKKTKRPG